MEDQLQRPQPFEDAHFSPVAEIFGLRGGVNSEIRYVRLPSGLLTVTARYGAKKKGFLRAEANTWSEDIVAYQEELLRRGVPLPPIEGIIIEFDQASQKAVIAKTSPWTGHDVSHLIQHTPLGNDDKILGGIVGQMCAILVMVCAERHRGYETEIGIDSRCSNFTIDASGKMWFVDLFPPRYRKAGAPLLEWPTPLTEEGRGLGLFKHYDARGITLTTIAQLSRVLPAQKSFFEERVLDGLAPAFSPAELAAMRMELSRAPWRQLRDLLGATQDTSGRKDAVEAIFACRDAVVFGVPYGVYGLREAALELAAAGRFSAPALEEFFRDSHFEDSLPSSVIDDLTHRLRRAVEV
ncbi:hypothetical protein EPN90_03050 [Patescibacteria group bacterium]|nr:MAG: hypothetical protein EPN90_03050 [Patescibacteria group bacterium]